MANKIVYRRTALAVGPWNPPRGTIEPMFLRRASALEFVCVVLVCGGPRTRGKPESAKRDAPHPQKSTGEGVADPSCHRSPRWSTAVTAR